VVVTHEETTQATHDRLIRVEAKLDARPAAPNRKAAVTIGTGGVASGVGGLALLQWMSDPGTQVWLRSLLPW
jgi:hypothetical protein